MLGPRAKHSFSHSNQPGRTDDRVDPYSYNNYFHHGESVVPMAPSQYSPGSYYYEERRGYPPSFNNNNSDDRYRPHHAHPRYAPPEGTESSITTDENYYHSLPPRHQQPNSRRGGGGGWKKHWNKLFRRNDHYCNTEQQALIKTAHPTPTTKPDRKNVSAGTFDTDEDSTSPLRNNRNSYNHQNSPVEQQQQQQRIRKWKQIKNQMNPDQWMRAMEEAQTLDGYASSAGGRGGGGETREELQRAAQDAIRAMTELSLWHCLAAILVYVSISIGCFSYWLERWTIVDSIYFAVVTFTTIGYGDVVPDTRVARLFTCAWAISGVACLGVALGVLGNQLIAVTDENKHKQRKRKQQDMMAMFDRNHRHHRQCHRDTGGAGSRTDHRLPLSPHRGCLDDGTTVESSSQWSDLGNRGVEDYTTTTTADYSDALCSQPYDNGNEDDGCCHAGCSKKVQRFLVLSIFLVTILYFISKEEGWNGWVAFYYGLITACTVGYGDISPKTESGRLLAILYIPIAVGLMGILLDIVASSIVARAQQGATSYWEDKELTLRDLRMMDVDGDGTVSRAEFLEFMLVATGQCDQDTLDRFKAQFDRLDADKSGVLDKADLIQMARTKLAGERMHRPEGNR